MSTRQNKKRKGRTLAIPRERTVTTLTDGPDTPFLHEASAGFMTSPFPGSPFASFNGFTMGHTDHTQQFSPTPQMVLPPGENDLEILEKLKDIIKNGQHEFYRAVPQPRALASLYLGRNAPAHAQAQPPAAQDGRKSPGDENRTRPPRIHNKDRSIAANNNKNQTKDDSGPGPMIVDASPSEARPLSDRLGPDDRHRPPSPVEHRSGQPLVRNGSTGSRDREARDWDGRDRDWERDRDDRDRDRGVRDERRMSDVRRPPPEQRHYEPSYDRYGHAPPPSPARALRPAASDEGTPRRAMDDRRPPPASPDTRPSPVDQRRPGPSPTPGADSRVLGNRASADTVRPTTMDERSRILPSHINSEERPRLEERIGNTRVLPSLQDRLTHPPSRAEDTLPARQASSLEDRISHSTAPATITASPIRSSANTSGLPSSADNRLPRPPIVPEGSGGRPAPRPTNDRTNAASRAASRPPLLPARPDDRPPARLPTETRYPPRPPSPDRGRVPPMSRPSGYDSHRASSVIRDTDPRGTRLPVSRPSLSPPRSVDTRDRLPPPLPRERSLPPPRGAAQRPDDNRYADDRRSDVLAVDPPSRFNDTRSTYPPRRFSPPSAADLARDRERARGMHPPPSPPTVAARGPPPVSSAYDDADRGRPVGDRRDWSYPSSHQYPDRRRDYDDEYWSHKGSAPPPFPSDRDRDRYERDPPPPPPRSQAWDPRDDRDRDRRSPPPRSYDPPPTRALSSRLTDSYPPPPPPAADRSYAPPAALGSLPRDDRRYPPPAPPVRASSPASYSRVRPRSPSPIGRRPPLPAADDMRPPPPKRQRDDAYPPGYYSPQSTRDALPPPPRRPSDYPPSRIGSPPPSTASSGYYDRPPPSGASGVDRDRGFGAPPPRDFARASYDRPRSPPPPRAAPVGAPYSRPAASTYSRPLDPRDDSRRYMPPPPRTA
ncbi:hypothetical protein BDN71DRAFT_510852 [Pleurotus eryngii]|uniref:Uncharacterized protein n=1 Tax=Pleurotus eryngii TaxID=5323 RepID=A0A9P6A121_PLEER|nr:hypothetical protein BDN71DRAFT_510852 [Pleurotus eryngii]